VKIKWLVRYFKFWLNPDGLSSGALGLEGFPGRLSKVLVVDSSLLLFLLELKILWRVSKRGGRENEAESG
jgi:hypothetical protein